MQQLGLGPASYLASRGRFTCVNPIHAIFAENKYLSLKATVDIRTECTNIEAQLGGYKGTWYGN